MEETAVGARDYFFKKMKRTLFAEYVLHCLLGPASIRRLGWGNKTFHFSARIPQKNKIKRVNVEATVEEWLNLSTENLSAQGLVRFATLICFGEFAQLDAPTEGSVWSAELPPGQTRCHKKALVLVEQIFGQLFPNDDNPIDSCITNEVLVSRIDPELLHETKKFILLGSQKDQISGRDIKAWVICVIRERRALELSLSDVRVGIERLKHGANYVLGVLVILACILTIVRESTIVIAVIIFIVSQTSAISVNFGDSTNHVLKGLMFFFIKRQFDVGDIIRKNNTWLVVENMHLLSTELSTANNEKTSIFNSTLLLQQDIYKKEEKDAECSVAF